MHKWIKDTVRLIRLSVLTRQLRQHVRVKPTLLCWCLVWLRVCLCSIRLVHSHSQEPSGIWSGLGGRIGLRRDCQHWPLSFPNLSIWTESTYQHSNLLLDGFWVANNVFITVSVGFSWHMSACGYLILCFVGVDVDENLGSDVNYSQRFIFLDATMWFCRLYQEFS